MNPPLLSPSRIDQSLSPEDLDDCGQNNRAVTPMTYRDLTSSPWPLTPGAPGTTPPGGGGIGPIEMASPFFLQFRDIHPISSSHKHKKILVATHVIDKQSYVIKNTDKESEILAHSVCGVKPHVARYHWSWSESAPTPFMRTKSLYIVMNHYQTTLAEERTFKKGVHFYTPNEALVMFRHTVRGLQSIHGCGFVHGDIRPHNVFVDAVAGEYVLGDFGSSYRMSQVPNWTFSDATYMDQATLKDRSFGREGDVFSLGMVLFETLIMTGPLPTSGDSWAAVRKTEMLEQVVAQSSMGIFRDVLLGMLHPTPKERWTLDQVMEALERL
eukprot:PhF_6_TR26348/c0_g1_i1/m.37931/K06632/WEE1; wee1-like protein kinase